MKKNLLALSLVTLLLASCDGGSSGGLSVDQGSTTKADLKITFFNGGYGETWINNLARRFEEANNCTVEVVSSNEGPCGAENYIQSGYNLSDIYIAEGVNWKNLVQKGQLEDLTDVYEAEVETRAGKQKIKDFMDQGIVGNFYAQRELKSTEYKPWAMPWTAKPNAMAYNEDILKAIKHTSTLPVTASVVDATTGLWVAPPETLSDLYAFCEDVKLFNNNSAEKQTLNDTHDYSAIGWCGGVNADSLGFLVVSWWAEYQGIKVSNVQGQGSFSDFFNFGNTTNSHIGQTFDINVWKQEGLINAYNKLADLLIDSSTGAYINTIKDPYNTNLQQLQQLFVANVTNKNNEKPVLTIASSYLENEVIKNRYLDSDGDGKQDVNFKFMNVPRLEESSEELLYLNFSDSMIIPYNAAHKELAKKFLIFMSSEQEIDNFTAESGGGVRPFNCDVRTEVTGNTYTPFVNSLFDVYYNSTHVYEYPSNVQSLAQVSHVFRYGGGSYLGGVDWLTMLSLLADPKGKTPGEAVTDASIQALQQNSINGTGGWLNRFKLTDISNNK